MFSTLYKDELFHKGWSVFSGGQETRGVLNYCDLSMNAGGILKAFLEDDDIQEVTITSANIGFSRTYTKQFRERKA